MKQKELLTLAVMVFCTIIAWVVIEVYTIRNKTNEQVIVTPTDISQIQLDTNVFDSLKDKMP